jgi:hypothetical protein
MSGPDKIDIHPPAGASDLEDNMTAEEFARRVDTLGADPMRWPESMRQARARLTHPDLGTTSAIRDVVREAAALSRVLDAAPSIDPRRLLDLTERISATARHTPRLAAQSPPNGTLPPALRSATSSVRAVKTATHATLARQRHRMAWPGAAVLAASLVMGIFVGQTDLSHRTLPTLVELAGLTLDHQPFDVGDSDMLDVD